MKVGIIGNGVVGRATARVWMEHADVRIHDMVPERATHKLHDVNECDLIFICLPEKSTDRREKRDPIELYCQMLNDYDKEFKESRNLVLKSTVPIGTTRRLSEQYGLHGLIHSPEFLTARCAVADAQVPARNIIGMPNRNRRVQEEIISPSGEKTVVNFPTQICYRTLRRMYETRFPGTPIQVMSSDESEAVKLMTNAFYACKVSIFNEFRSLADKLDLSWETVLAGMLSGGVIGSSHTQVPGPDLQFGWGGSCFPKDCQELKRCLGENGLESWMVSAALLRNTFDRKREVDR